MLLKKKLYLHVGIHKTATTSLQNFFDLNRNNLYRNNICYPEHGIRKGSGVYYHVGAHHELSQTIKSNVPIDEAYNNFKSLLDKIYSESTNQEIVLISSEVFSEDIHLELLELLFEYFYEIKIVIYIRRQDKLSLSVYNQYIKSGWNKNTSICKIKEILPGRIDYFKTLNKWSDIFGKENIIIRIFEKESFNGGNIYSDFMINVFSIELSIEFILPGNDLYNKSLNFNTLEFKRLVNHLNIKNEYKLKLLPYLYDYDDKLETDFNYYLLSYEDSINLLDSVKESNRKVAVEYLNKNNGTLFHPPKKEYFNNLTEYSGLSEDKMREIINYININNQYLIETISDGIDAALISKNAKVITAASYLEEGMKNLLK